MESPSSGSKGKSERSFDRNRQTPGGKLPQIPPSWKFAFWYVPIVFVLLWLGLGAFVRMNVRTIPYSEFKEHIRRKEVVECIIREDVIEGRIHLQTNAPAQKAESKTQPGETFVFRTGRVEDPQLVEDLQDAGVKYVGARQSSWLQLVTAWVVPLLLMTGLAPGKPEVSGVWEVGEVESLPLVNLKALVLSPDPEK